MLRSAGRYENPRALDCATGTASVRDQSHGGQTSPMWSRDHNASPINWLLLRHKPESDASSSTRRPRKCYLLDAVPLEIREMILRHCLPHTFPYNGGTAWYRGSMSILRVNKQLYEEGTNILYHNNTFSLDVIYDCSYFAMTWLTPTQDPAVVLHVRRQRAFPECLSKRNVPKMRRFEITVRHVDSYLGETKYGYGGGGLTDGLRTQVVYLCQTLRRLPVIDVLEISYQCQDARRKSETQSVLDPFFTLQNVREVKTSGHVMEQTSEKLKRHYSEARQKQLQDQDDNQTERDAQMEMSLPRQSSTLDTEVVAGPLTRKGFAYYRGYDGREI